MSACLATMNITHFSQGLGFNYCVPNRRVLERKHVAFMGKAESDSPQPVCIGRTKIANHFSGPNALEIMRILVCLCVCLEIRML